MDKNLKKKEKLLIKIWNYIQINELVCRHYRFKMILCHCNKSIIDHQIK